MCGNSGNQPRGEGVIRGGGGGGRMSWAQRLGSSLLEVEGFQAVLMPMVRCGELAKQNLLRIVTRKKIFKSLLMTRIK